MPDNADLNFSKCGQCGFFQYPPREFCSHCWSEELKSEAINPYGMIIAETWIHYSLEEELQKTVPNHIGLIKMDQGPTLFANLGGDVKKGDRVHVTVYSGLNNLETFAAQKP